MAQRAFHGQSYGEFLELIDQVDLESLSSIERKRIDIAKKQTDADA